MVKVASLPSADSRYRNRRKNIGSCGLRGEVI